MFLISQKDAEQWLCQKGEDTPVTRVLSWLKEFIAQPNAQLGRTGTVCPFVPKALRLSVLWLTEVAFASLPAELESFRDKFFSLEPTDAERKIGKTVLVVVPDMPADVLTDGRWLTWLDRYLEVGLKLTLFHPQSKQSGMHNHDFLSHASPLPVLTIRHLHVRDRAFVTQMAGTPEGDLLSRAHERLFNN
jgi:hypothetical protein